MTGVYLSQGIYWNSETSPLLGDGFINTLFLMWLYEISYMEMVVCFTPLQVASD